MKTSNKLLIAFGLALILIPLLGMVYISQVKFKDGGSLEDRTQTTEHFNSPSSNMTSKAIPTAFSSINIADAKNMYLSVHLIKDEQTGIKISNRFKDNVGYTIDEKGVLQLTIKDVKGSKSNYIQLFIYSKDINQLSLNNVEYLDFHSKIDSLHLDVKKTGTVSMRNKNGMKKLTFNGEDVKSIEFGKDDVKWLSLDLKNSGFESEDNSYDELAIRTSGTSTVTIKGDEDQNQIPQINKLTIHTLDQADVKFENVKINTCTGSLSDQTKVQMPAINLKQLFK